jgi:biopolymer transport protein ExbB/TolQ
MDNIWISAWEQFDIAGKFIIIVLVLLSFHSWYIILEKFFYLRQVEKRNRMFERLIKKGKNPRLIRCPLSSILNYGIELRDKAEDKSIDIHLEKAFIIEQGKLESKITTLGTIATVSPFLGLWGTVWGLFISFQGIVASGSSSVRVVAGGVSIALVTTIVGLAVAIPAAVGHNYYREKVMNILERMEFFFPYILHYLKSFSDRMDS